MLTQTTLTAIRTLVYVGLNRDGEPFSVRHVADRLGVSPTYLAKVARQLVKAGILRAHRGVTGGIELNLEPKAITLRAIVEACQGVILPNFCQATTSLEGVCAFHVAAVELHQATVRVLDRWSLEQLVQVPEPSRRCRAVPCLVQPRSDGVVGAAAKANPQGLRGTANAKRVARFSGKGR